MNCVDVNVLVYAHRPDLPEHEPYRDLLERLANGAEPLGVPDAVLAGFLRVVTSRRVFVAPTPPVRAWEMAAALMAAPAVMFLRPTARHWAAFGRLALEAHAAGSDLADAYLAAYAVENNATWLSADRGFARFPGLRWRHPLG